MRGAKILGLACIMAATAMPAFAADTMGTMGMMKGGEVMAVMPDGHMGTMTVTDPMKTEAMMKMATPIDHCMMIMTGADGKVFMVDTSSMDAAKECEKMTMAK